MKQLRNQKAFSSVLKILVCAATSFLVCNSFANEALARKNNCLGCHAVAVQLVGPAFKDVAAKYAGQSDAVALTVESVRNGSVGKWGELPMPAHPKLSAADANKLVEWVLKAK